MKKSVLTFLVFGVLMAAGFFISAKAKKATVQSEQPQTTVAVQQDAPKPL